MKAFPLILFIPAAIRAVDLEQVKREGAVLFLEENGDTTSASAVEREVADSLGNQLLDILELDDLPRPKRSKRDEKMTNFMAKFYSKMNEEEQKPGCSSGLCELHEWVEADGIVSLSPEKVEALPDGDTYKVKFPSRSIIATDDHSKNILIAQLQIFLHGQQSSLKIWASPSPGFDKAQVIFLGKNDNYMKMNVTEMAAPWFHKGADTTLFIRIDNDGPSTGLITLDVFVMVGFKEGGRSAPNKRVKRSMIIQEPTTPSNSVPRKPRRLDMSANANPNPLDGCRKQGLYVSFADLGWKEWLIAPEGYAAYFCGGACDFPLHNRMNATNHAIVQTLAHLVDPGRAQKAKCAPVQLTSMKILFVDNNQNVVMRRFRDMVVQECGCH